MNLAYFLNTIKKREKQATEGGGRLLKNKRVLIHNTKEFLQIPYCFFKTNTTKENWPKDLNTSYTLDIQKPIQKTG